MKIKYKSIIRDNSVFDYSGTVFTKTECDHKHTTISGTKACLKKLSEYYPDNCHNGWAHFGEIVKIEGGELKNLNIAESLELNDMYYKEYCTGGLT
ncbi:MAG TPA: hypothetical protein ENI61_05315 [Ignavibacteria bacterium]|nr:hypothetical protein [Ignavibacteria bacterium]